MHFLERLLEWGGIKRDILFLAISLIALLFSLFNWISLPLDAAWIAIVLCGLPILLEALHGLITAFDIKADVLVSIALVASIAIDEDFAAGEVAFIMQLGGLLEELTVARARAGIEKLVRLTPHTARRIEGNALTVVPAEAIRVGDLVRVLPGETVPVDGKIRSGQTSVNQAVMTGESLPVDKGVGDEVFSGTVNQFGSFDMEATKVGEDSSIQRMIRLVQSADASKAKIVGLADRWATWIVVIALLSAAVTWILSGQILRAVTILVVFCPCALVLATPTAVMAAIGNATRHGFLVREGDALERLARVRRFAFDKTGTLTQGTPRVVAVQALCGDFSREQIYSLAAAAEVRSEHPLGKAVVRSYRETEQREIPEAEQFIMLPGLGVSARIQGRTILAGNERLLAEHGVAVETAQAKRYLQEGCTVIYLCVDARLAGLIALSDTLRPESSEMIAHLKAAGAVPVLLTGDHENAATQIARRLSIGEVHANCRPEDKLRWIREHQARNQQICMIGDGINDAPALKTACVGIAMGGIGSDIAVDAADIALVGDDLQKLPHLYLLSQRMMRAIQYNMAFSMALNFAAILLAMSGTLNPVLGALVHNAGSVLVIAHSAFLLRWKKKSAARPLSSISQEQ